MHLLEREHLLASLSEYAAESRQGAGRLVLVAGEAGAGKSSLVDRFQEDLPDARWLRAACDGLFTPRPLGPLQDLAEAVGGDLRSAVLAGAPREELFSAFAREIGRSDTLTVLVIEDIHWADEATLDLLRFVGRRLRTCATLLIATHRDEALRGSAALQITLGDLAILSGSRRFHVPPLSPQAVETLTAGSGFEAQELHRLTGGNAFLVTEIIQSGEGYVPPSARDAALARVAHLSGSARTCLEAAALLGTRVEPTLLAAVAPEENETLHRALDEMVMSGVLVSDGPTLRFRHEITRMAVEEDVPAHRRQSIHGRILAALRLSGSWDDARLAHHAEGAGDGPAVLAHAPAAARRAAELRSHRESAAQYERALRFAEHEDPRTTGGLLDGLAGELVLIDRWRDAADARHRALALWREVGDPVREGDTLVRLSRMQSGQESSDNGYTALAVLEPLGPTVELAWAHACVAGRHMVIFEHLQAVRAARQAQALAELLDLPAVLSDALNTEGCVAARTGGDWPGLLKRALMIALDARADEQAARAYTSLVELLGIARRFPEAEHFYVDGIAFCDEHDITTYGSCIRAYKAANLEQQGHWDDAVDLAQRLLVKAGSHVNRLYPLFTIGRVGARRGDPTCWAALDQLRADAESTGEAPWIALAHLSRSEAYWLEGRMEEARAEIAPVRGWADVLDEWDRGAAATWLRRLGLDRSALTGPIAEPYGLSLEGDFEEAARRWDELGCPYDAALARYDSDTEEGLRDALRRFEALGAGVAAEATRRQMRSRGLRAVPAGPHPRTRAHPAGLTRRECEVLEEIVAGHTNAEISDRLFISVKTVDHHVSAVLSKLGVRSRGAAASEALRLGLGSPAPRS